MSAKNKSTKSELEGKKLLAYTLYVEVGYDQKLIAELLHVSENSISNWKKADKTRGRDWEEDRTELRQGFDKERRRIKQAINDIMDAIQERKKPKNVPNSGESDSINKLTVAARNLQAEYVTLHQKNEVGKLMIAHMQKLHGKEKAVEFVQYWHEFIMSNV
jgi:predicted transcriptional regulator